MLYLDSNTHLISGPSPTPPNFHKSQDLSYKETGNSSRVKRPFLPPPSLTVSPKSSISARVNCFQTPFTGTQGDQIPFSSTDSTEAGGDDKWGRGVGCQKRLILTCFHLACNGELSFPPHP